MARKPTHEEKVVLELSSIKAEIRNLSANLGKWLAAIAKAAATPSDNSAEIQRLIDEQAAKLDSDATAINEALNQANQTKEN